MFKSISRPSPFPRAQVVRLKVPTLKSLGWIPGNCQFIEVFPKVTSLTKNSGVVERGLVMNNKKPSFHLSVGIGQKATLQQWVSAAK